MLHSTKKSIINGVNVALLEPVETLSPDHLKKFSKEELGAYLVFYDVDISRTDTKPELKRLLRGLLAQLKDGSVAKKHGIGVDWRRPTFVPSPSPTLSYTGDSPSVVSKVSTLSSIGPSGIMSTSVRSPVVVSAQPALNRGVYAGISSGIMSTTKGSVSKRGDAAMGMDRPAILDEEMETNATDLAVPIAVSKLETSHPQLQSRMWRYYHSLVDTHAHLEAVPASLVSRNSFEPPVLHYVGDTCVLCGNRAISSCKYRRCRSCCNASSKSCTVHAIGHDPIFALPRPLERTGAPGTLASAQSGVGKSTRRSAPSLPRPTTSSSVLGQTSHMASVNTHPSQAQSTQKATANPPAAHMAVVRLGEIEATNPWLELKDEAQYRHFQNATCMDTIFDHHSTDSLSQWLQQWQSTSIEGLQQKLASSQQELSQLQETHTNRMNQWIERSILFKQRMGQLEALADEENPENTQTLQQLREGFLADLDSNIPVPIVPRKRTAQDNSQEPDPKRRSTRI